MNIPIRVAIPLKITAQRSPLAGYLAGAAGMSALLTAPQAEAAVTAVSFGFGTQYTVGDGASAYWTVGPGFGTTRAIANENVISLGSDPAAAKGSFYQTASYSAVWGLPKFFTSGTVIGAGGNGALGVAYFQATGLPALDFISDHLNKNIGFKTSTNKFGWANVSWTNANKTLTINSAFVESVANTPITITAVPEPSRALLALAGLGGVALRRRRKPAA